MVRDFRASSVRKQRQTERGSRSRVERGPLVFYQPLNLHFMTIKLLNVPKSVGHPFVSAVMACYILHGGLLRVDGPYVLFEVVDWVDWLRVVNSAFAALSRHSYPDVMRMRHPVHVVGLDEVFFVAFDEEWKGVRYGSI